MSKKSPMEILPFIPLSEPAQYYIGRKQQRSIEQSGKLYTVLTSRNLESVPGEYVNYFRSLYSMFDPTRPTLYLSHEMHATRGKITNHLWVPHELQDFVQKLTQAVDVSAEVLETPSDYLRPDRFKYRHTIGAEMRLHEHAMFPVLQSDGDRFKTDVMAPLCAAMAHLKDGDEIIVQFLLRPLPQYTQKLVRMKYDNYERFGSRPVKGEGVFAKLEPWTRSTMLPLAALHHGILAPILGNAGKLKPQEDKEALGKVNEGQFFDVSVRILSTSKDMIKCRENLTTVLAAFAPTAHKNRWQAERVANEKPLYKVPFMDRYLWNRRYADQLLEKMSKRRIGVFYEGNWLSPRELSSVLHYPDGEIPFVTRLRSRKLPVPEGVEVYDSIDEAWQDNAIVIGFSDYRGDKKYVAIKDQKTFSRHLYLIGTTGSGKTTLLQFIAIQVARLWGWGLVYYDVKGDALDKLMQFLPEDDLLYIDLSNQVDRDDKRTKTEKVYAQFYVPFNMLRFPQMTDYALAELIVGVFVRVFGERNLMFKSQNDLRRAILAVVATDPDATILEVYRLFTDEAYLDQTIERLEQSGKYPPVLAYWRDVYKKAPPKTRYNEMAAILNKLESIVNQEKPRYTFCQKENVLPWREILDQQKKVLINLAQGSNSDETQRLFGTLFTAYIKRAAWSREDTPEEDRPPVLFVLDEFEKFAGNAADIEEMLALARSYGVCLLMAHQSADQVETSLLNQVIDLTSTNICLNVGQASAAKLHKSYPKMDAEDLQNLVPHQAAIRIKTASNETFTMNTLPVEGMAELTKEVEKIKKRQYQQWYRHVSTIEKDIQERYALTEKNRKNEGGGKVGGRKRLAGGTPHGTVPQKETKVEAQTPAETRQPRNAPKRRQATP